jgi:hypothetical protein
MNIHRPANKFVSNTDDFESCMWSADKLPTESNGSEPFGLTDEEYEFLQDDINQTITEGNRKYGFGDSGYVGTDGYFHPLPVPDPYNDKPRQTLTLKPKSKCKRKRRIGPSIEQVAVARGIIRAIHKYSVPKELSH